VAHAFVDSSVAVAIAFEEPTARALLERLRAFDTVFASPLMEAELRSALRRESRDFDPGFVSAAIWVNPLRSLSLEIGRVLAAGYVRGAHCWHLASALYVCAEPAKLVFLTLDKRQRDVAQALGFAT
jgi:predicted nucleic acid-binding protein